MRRQLAVIGALGFAFCGAFTSSAAATAYTSAGPITINDNGGALPFGAAVNVAGEPAGEVINNIMVTLNDVTHPKTDDLDVVLLSPANEAITLISDAAGATALAGDDLTFFDGAKAAPPTFTVAGGSIGAGELQPANIGGFDNWGAALTGQAGTEGGGYPSALDAVLGDNPNGTWKLFVQDDTAGGAGTIASGWTLDIWTEPPSVRIDTDTSYKVAANIMSGRAVRVAEGDGVATFTIRKLGIGAVTVGYDTIQRSATAGVDYAAIGDSVSFGAGETTKTIQVPILDDSTPEGVENAVLRLTSAPGYLLGGGFENFEARGASQATAVIVDDDPPAQTVSGSQTTDVAIPAAGAGNPYPSVINISGAAGPVRRVQVQLTDLDTPRLQDLGFRLQAPNGGATDLLSRSGHGATSATYDLSFRDNGAIPGHRAYLTGTILTADIPTSPVSFSPPAPFAPLDLGRTMSEMVAGAANGDWKLFVFDDSGLGGPSTLGGWSLEIETAATSTVSAGGGQPTAESAPSASIGVSNSGGIAGTVNYATTGGTAKAGVDYTPVSGQLSFAAGSFSKPINIPLVNDAADEPPETIEVTLSDPSTGLTIGTQTGAVTVTDDDPAASVVSSGAGPGVTIDGDGPASPYPSVLDVSGVQGTVTKVIPRLNGLSHLRSRDLAVLLVGPTGAYSVLLRGNGGDNPVAQANLAFDDFVANAPPSPLTSGTFQPFGLGGPPLPAPAPPQNSLGFYTSQVSDLAGLNPNGQWKLFVHDDKAGQGGSLAGWSLDFELIPPPPPPPVAPPPPPPAPDRTKPRISSLALTPVRFRAASRGGSLAAVRVGTRLSYRLSENARVTFRVERPQAGRRVGRRCVKQTRANRRRRACRRYVTMTGSFVKTSKAGSNTARFTGRLRNRKLRPGSYRLVATARDSAGNTSSALRKDFRIVK